MRKLGSFLPSSRWARLVWIFATYVVAADFLPNLLMLVVNCSGYLPYCDRPGPGWQAPHWPQMSELSFFFGFALYMGIPTLLYAAGQTLLALTFEFCSLPKWLVRLLGAVLGFLAAGLLMQGAGWMIAIAPIGVFIAAGCGFVWGMFVLPLFLVLQEPLLPSVARILLPLALFVGALFALIYPLLPRVPIAPITFEMNRVTPGTQIMSVDATPYLKPQTRAEIAALHLHGKMHGGIQSSAGTGNSNGVDVVVIALQPIDREYRVEVPATGHVVYVLADDKLVPHPAFSKKDKRIIRIEPGTDKTFDGGRMRVGSAPDFTAFTWYPTIRR